MRGSVATYAVAAVFVMLWSSGWIVGRIGTDDLGVLTLLAIRYGVVAAVLGVLVVASDHWRAIELRECVPYLIVGVLSHALYLAFGLGAFAFGASVGLVAFITALQPMIAAGLTVPITHERISSREWAGLALGLAAVLLVITEKMWVGFSPVAVLLPLGSVLALALGTVLHRRIVLTDAARGRTPLPLLQVMLLQVVAAFAVLLVAAAISAEPWPTLTTRSIGAIVWLALGVSLLAYAMMTWLLARLPAFKVSSLNYLTPPATMFLAWVVFGDGVGPIDLVGLVLALAGVVMTIAKPSRAGRDERRRYLPPEVLWKLTLDIEL